jgi:hypothetical protein
MMGMLSAANIKWAPVLMDSIITFVPYTESAPPPILMEKKAYYPDETVSATINMKLSGDQDWAGIYPANTSSDWENVIAWNWVEEQGRVVLNRDGKPMPAGSYEVRLFFHNSTSKVEASYPFTVVDNSREFGTQGPYLDQVRSVKTTEDGEVTEAIYYVEDETGLPTVIFMSGWKSNLESYDGFLQYVASLGYCVVAKMERGKCFTPDVYEEELTTQLSTARDTYHADISKLGIIGHSSGGGIVFYLMDYFQSNGIAGTAKSVVMSIDGWFPFGVTKAQLNSFDTPALLMQFGGLDGINQEGTHPDWDDYAGEPYHHYQDPRINLAIFKVLTYAGLEKEYVVLEANNNHGYIAGDYDTIIARKDLLAPIDELLNHTLGTGDAMYFVNRYDDVILNDTISEYRYYCHTAGFNFCDLDNPTFP